MPGDLSTKRGTFPKGTPLPLKKCVFCALFLATGLEIWGAVGYHMTEQPGLGSRPTAGHMTLDHGIGVRIPASQPFLFGKRPSFRFTLELEFVIRQVNKRSHSEQEKRMRKKGWKINILAAGFLLFPIALNAQENSFQ